MFDQMLLLLEPLTSHPDMFKILCLPVVAGLVGFGTNWLAVKMTFYPEQPIGKPPFFGWQGILPMKQEKMAGIMVDSTLSKLGSMEEILREMEPAKIAAHISQVTGARIEEYSDEIMSESNGVLWDNMPLMVKERVYSRAKRQIPIIMEGLIEDITNNIERLVDMKTLVVDQLRSEDGLITRVFLEVGAPEFNFVIKSGFIFGFIFGLIQIPVWIAFENVNWILPLFGFLVGTATNWLALNMIFSPLNPIKVGPFTFHGLFLRRQDEVAETFSQIATEEILTVQNLMTAVMNGPKAHLTKAMIKKHVRPFIEGGVVRTAAQLTVGPSGYANLKRSVESKALDMSMDSFDDPQFNQERAVVASKLFRERMQAMTSEEFQDLLRPAFKEDEWILVAIGGFLGMVAGFVQLVYVFGQPI